MPISTLREQTDRHRYAITVSLAIAVATWYGVALLATPVQYTDTDFWAYLTAGRYIIETGELYNPMVYSFIGENRPTVEYTTGFQLLTYLLWQSMGPVAVILLRASFYLISGWFVIRLLSGDAALRDWSSIAVAITLCVLFMLYLRSVSIRPQMVSYAFIPLSIYILAYRPRWLPLLPLITVVWANTHGVEWIIAAFIGGSWLLAKWIEWQWNKSLDKPSGTPYGTQGKQPVAASYWWVVVCLPAVAISPAGFALFTAPFLYSPDLDRFITELAPITLQLDFDLSNGLARQPLFLLLLLLTIAGLVIALAEWRRHVFFLLLGIGGLLLLTRGNRFIWEWLLLSLPLLHLTADALRRHFAAGGAITVVLLVLAAQALWLQLKPTVSRYPYDTRGLPAATTAFIKSQQLEARYAVSPVYAGYVMWELVPDIEIHSTMNFPGYSTLMLHEIVMAERTDAGFAHFIDRYHPGLFGARRSNPAFADFETVKQRFAPVFADNRLVLYASREQFPQLVETFELKAFDPYKPDIIRADQQGAAIGELERLLQHYPDLPEFSSVLASRLLALDHAERAERVITAARALDADDPRLIYSAGEIKQHQSDYLAAVNYYRRLDADSDAVVAKAMAECYFMLLDHHNAYKYYRLAINPYTDRSPDLVTYHHYALVALASGQRAEALRLLQMTAHFDAGDNPEERDRIERLLAELTRQAPVD